jgi:phosphate transport system substrate-binding protein
MIVRLLVALIIVLACSLTHTLEAAKAAFPPPQVWKIGADKLDAAPSARIKTDATIPEYTRAGNISGTIRSTGSSVLSNLLFRWSSEFKLIYPGAEVEITGGGSESAPVALVGGTADIAPMSRPMNAREVESFKSRFGYEPTRVTVALDAIAVYVHKNNPVKSLSFRQLDQIFSNTRKRGGAPAKTWGAIEKITLPEKWAATEIELKGPNRTQGIYSVFRDQVLQGGEYRFEMKAEPVASSIVQAVGADETAIGFASYFYASRRTRTLDIAAEENGPAVGPTQQNVLDGTYPLARKLYIYVNKAPNAPLAATPLELLRYICSQSGQNVVARDGNYPLSAILVENECTAPLR